MREISVTEAIEIVKRKTGGGPADDAESFLADRSAIRGFILREIEYSFALQLVIQAAEKEAKRQAMEESQPTNEYLAGLQRAYDIGTDILNEYDEPVVRGNPLQKERNAIITLLDTARRRLTRQP